VDIALDKVLLELDLQHEPEIMSPSAKAVTVAAKFKAQFTTQTKP